AALQRGGNSVDGDPNPAGGEQAVQPPAAGAGAILVDRFHAPVALARPRRRTHALAEEPFGRRVAVQDAALATFLVIDDELYGDVGATRPLQVRGGLAIAEHVAGVTHADVLSCCGLYAGWAATAQARENWTSW